MKQITIMGNDAGSTNYGYSVIKFYLKNNKLKYQILECGQLNNRLTDLKVPAKTQLKKYINEINAKIRKYKIEQHICERYMPRGRFGNTSEYVNIMIGYLLASKLPVTLITASMWKNRLNRFMGGKGKLDKFCKAVCVPQHEIDATFQAMYLAEKIFKMEILDKFKHIKNLIKLKQRVERCTTSEKINRRATLVR